jgi:hypothetical protein
MIKSVSDTDGDCWVETHRGLGSNERESWQRPGANIKSHGSLPFSLAVVLITPRGSPALPLEALAQPPAPPRSLRREQARDVLRITGERMGQLTAVRLAF